MSENLVTLSGDVEGSLYENDVLETFHRLPDADQKNFSRWIEMARGSKARWRRIDVLVLALRSSILHQEHSAAAPIPKADGWT